jgi:hypothetical protein
MQRPASHSTKLAAGRPQTADVPSPHPGYPSRSGASRCSGSTSRIPSLFVALDAEYWITIGSNRAGSGLRRAPPRCSGRRAFTGPAILATILGADPESTVPVFARVLPDDDADRLLAEARRCWSRVRSITDSDGREVSSIRRSEDGSVFLPFDPDEVILNYWSERYAAIGAGAKARLQAEHDVIYYRLRPLLPRHLQIWLRRRFARCAGALTVPALAGRDLPARLLRPDALDPRRDRRRAGPLHRVLA